MGPSARSTTFFMASAALVASLVQPAAAQVDVKDYEVEEVFQGERATDLSGIACIPMGENSYRCLAVNDENQTAQFAEIEGNTIKALKEVPLIGDSPDPKTLGTLLEKSGCPRKPDWSDLDGEGVAYAAPYFYVVGSHGCSRGGKFRRSSFVLARIRIDDQGRPVDEDGKVLKKKKMSKAVETTYRLSDILKRAEKVGAHFGKEVANDHSDADRTMQGLNIEGIAVDGKNVFLGLRAPSLGGNAFIVRTKLDALFAPGHAPAPSDATVETLSVALDDNVGIRDLALLPDGRLLILTGAAHAPEAELPYSIYVVDQSGENLRKVFSANDKQPTRAEAMTVLDATPEEARLLLMFDGPLDGAPQGIGIPLP